jgi:Putative transmembrane protein (PGPGW)
VAMSAVGGLLPGPGWGTAIIGFALIAGEFLPAARLLDRAEVKLRHFWQFVRDVWGHSWAGKVLVIAVTALIAAAIGYAVYFLLFAR